MAITINHPKIDWITATTWDASLFKWAVEQLEAHDTGKIIQTKRRQYLGKQSDGLFYGKAEQNGKRHFMIIASGEFAHDAFGVLNEHFHITRLDIQLTIEKPGWYSARNFCDEMRQGQWPGRRRVAGLRENGKGEDTVYIGSRTSDKFIRVYVKHMHYLRFEIELKGEYARHAREMIREGKQNALSAILSTEIMKLPAHPISGNFKEYCTGRADLKSAYKSNPEMAAKMKWLASLLPTIEAMSNDHDYGDTVKIWLREIIDHDRED